MGHQVLAPCRFNSGLEGQNKDALAKTKLGAWEYDVIGPWYKCNMTDVMAGMGLAQFERYPSMLARRKEIISRFDAAFAELPVALMNHYGDDFASSGHLYLVRLVGRGREDANRVIEHRMQRSLQASPNDDSIQAVGLRYRKLS